jgi:hypothetical protein
VEGEGIPPPITHDPRSIITSAGGTSVLAYPSLMWRTKAGRADIANCVLIKLGNYGRAIGLLQ